MEVVLSDDAKKQLKRLPKTARIKIFKKLDLLEKNPNSGKKLGGELSDFWSIRVWPYRIIYEIDIKLKRIDVHRIAHRQGAYN